MMKKIAFHLLFTLSFGYVYSQVAPVNASWGCGQGPLMNQLRSDSSSPGFQRYENLEQDIYNAVQGACPYSHAGPYTIPVVFHILHDGDQYGTGSNISYNQIQWQLAALNAAFSASYPTYNGQLNGPHAFDSQIRFCLATNPMGNDASGNPVDFFINTSTSQTECGVMRYAVNSADLNTDLTIAAQNQLLSITHNYGTGLFPFDNYLNIWVVDQICTTPSSGCGIIGYGTMPGNTPLDGIVMRSDAIGDNTISTNNFTMSFLEEGKILAHEVGHYLGLFHTFEPNDCAANNNICAGIDDLTCATGGDRVCDTPPSTFCNNFINCGMVMNTCFDDLSCYGNADQFDHFTNFMCFAIDNCMNEFTEGQVARMEATLASPAGRDILVSAANLTATGVSAQPFCSCSMNTNGFTSIYGVGTCGQMTFIAPQASNLNGISYSWDFGDLTPLVSGSIVTHTFTSAGPFNVCMTATDPGGNSVTTCLQVNPMPVATATILNQGTVDVCLGTEVTMQFEFTGPAPYTVLLTNGSQSFMFNSSSTLDAFSFVLPATTPGTETWSVAQFLAGPGQCPFAVSGSIIYNTSYCSCNMFTNGDFETGNIAPSATDYTLSLFQGFGLYNILQPSQAQQAPNNWGVMPNLPAGNGLSMIVDNFTTFVNANPVPNNHLWCQAVNLQANTDYRFDFQTSGDGDFNGYAMNPHQQDIQFILIANNTQQLGGISTVIKTIPADVWMNSGFTFNSGSLSGNTQLCLAQISQADPGGNSDDFFIDNIRLREFLSAPLTLTVTPSNPVIVSSSSVTLIASGGTGYTWTPAAGLNTTTGSTVVASPTVTTTYSVTNTDPDCPISGIVTVIVITPCSTFGAPQVLPPVISSSYPAGNYEVNSNLTANGIVNFVNSTITFNSNVTVSPGCVLRFNNCTVRMNGMLGQNVKVDVQPGGTLIIENNSRVFSCNSDLWDGIYVSSSASATGLVQVLSNSWIEDANHAIVSINGGNFFCDHAFFNKNYKSIEVQAFNGTHPGVIQSSVFSSLSTPGFSGVLTTLKSPHTNRPPAVGVEITDVQNITIGTTLPAQLNIFESLECGVHVLNNSFLTLWNNEFRDILYSTYCSPLPCANTGIGVLVENFSTLVAGGSPTLKNKFKNCSNGIVTRVDVDSDIQYNDFDQINAALVLPSRCVFLERNITQTMNISNNTMKNFRNGVEVRGHDKCLVDIRNNDMSKFPKGIGVYCLQNNKSTVNIFNNVFNNNNPNDKGLTAIRVQNAVLTTNGPVDIQTNVIRGCKTGITATSINSIQIRNLNDVEFKYTQPPGTPDYGIRIMNCPTSLIDNNRVTKQGNALLSTAYTQFVYGVAVEIGCVGTVVSNNVTQRLGTGFLFNMGNNLPLYVSCNFMTNNRMGMELRSTNIADQGSPISAQDLNGIAQDNQWAVPNQTAFWGATNNTMNSPIFYSRGVSPPWTAGPQSPPASLLFNNTTYHVPNASYTCINGCPNPPCSQQQLAKLASGQSPYDNPFSSIDRYNTVQTAYLRILHDTILYQLGTPDDSVLVSFKDSVAVTNIGRFKQISDLFAAYDTTAAIINQGLNPAYTPEVNQKIVNEIYSRTWALGIWSFSVQDTLTLYSIAYQNPDEGGRAVLDARVMLLYDQDDFGHIHSRLTGDQNSVNDEYGQMYPNPATDEAIYEITLDDSSSGVIQLWDIHGRMLQTQSLAAGDNRIHFDVGRYSTGLYVYRVYVNGEAKAADILVISE
jgi:hypothetical protein